MKKWIYMKKSCLILSLCIFPSFAFAFNDLPTVKKNIANKLIHCISHPQSDGAAYINICYGEAADEFIRQGNSYVEDRLSKTDAFSSVEDIKYFLIRKLNYVATSLGKALLMGKN